MSPTQDEPTLQEMSRRLAEVERANADLHKKLANLQAGQSSAPPQVTPFAPGPVSPGNFGSQSADTPAVQASGMNGADGIDALSDSGTGIFVQVDSGAGIFVQVGSGTGLPNVKGTGISCQSSEGVGIYATSTISTGVRGESDTNFGVVGQSSTGTGIQAIGGRVGLHAVGLPATPADPPPVAAIFAQSLDDPGVIVQSRAGDAIRAESELGTGIFARSTSSSSSAIFGFSQDGVGVRGESLNGVAGVFDGFVEITRDLTVDGSVIQRGGGFLIDHPKDPAHKFLFHSFVESPDMKNIYDGVVVLSAQGEAEVTLPAWFDALNTDFRYQLTAIGAAGPDLYIAEEMHANRFKIAGGKPHLKVSWQVTGIRQDAWAKAHPLPVEQDKPA